MTEMPKSLLHIKYWPMWLLVGILYILAWLPKRLRVMVGRGIGSLFYRFASYRVDVVRTNLKLCFPHKTEAEREQLTKTHCQSFAMGLIESAMAWFLPKDKLMGMLKGITGLEHVKAAKAENRPILYLGAHVTSLDLGGPYIAMQGDVFGMYRKAKNPVLEYVIQKGRMRHLTGMYPQKALREIINHLKQGEDIWYASDQDFGTRAKGVFSPFFGVDAYTIALYAKLARKADAVVIPASIFRCEDGDYVGCYLPAIDVNGLSDQEAANKMNQAIEKMVEPHLEQYYWLHRRFKTRPPGESDLYPEKPSQIKRRLKAQKKKHQNQ